MGEQSLLTLSYILRVRAVALLVFLTRATGARFIATDFWLVAHHSLNLAGFLTGWRRALIWPGKRQRRGRRGMRR